jgi:hypothetical protein
VSRFQKPIKAATLEMVLAEVQKLCRHTEQLEKSIDTLSGRIIPYDGEQQRPSRYWYEEVDKFSGDPGLQQIWELTRLADRHIQTLEYDLQAVRSKIEREEDSTWIKEELIPYLKPRPQRK